MVFSRSKISYMRDFSESFLWVNSSSNYKLFSRKPWKVGQSFFWVVVPAKTKRAWARTQSDSPPRYSNDFLVRYPEPARSKPKPKPGLCMATKNCKLFSNNILPSRYATCKENNYRHSPSHTTNFLIHNTIYILPDVSLSILYWPSPWDRGNDQRI